MLDTLLYSPLTFIISLISLVAAVTIHEFAHAFVADKLGDPTPRSQGRVSLNPLKHLDLFGSLALLFIGFGWGKPVQFDPYNLKNPRKEAALISIAGPVSNIMLALIVSLAAKFTLPDYLYYGLITHFVIINASLAVFNLVPVGPLDGQKILLGLLPVDLAYEFQSIMSRYGTFILILLILPTLGGNSPISQLISPAIAFVSNHLIF